MDRHCLTAKEMEAIGMALDKRGVWVSKKLPVEVIERRGGRI